MNEFKWHVILHIIVLLLLIGSIIMLFFENPLFIIVPVILYITVHKKNSLLLLYLRAAKAEIKGLEIIFDDTMTDIFCGRELFVLSMMNLLMAIVFNSIINLFAAIYLIYITIVQCEYIKI